MSDQEQKGFTIVDKRGSAAGEGTPETPPAPAEETPETPPAPAEDRAPGGAAEGSIPRIDFATFVLSLGTSALYHMGIAPDPASGQAAPEPNLPLARQTIDTLEMLAEKTRGNLDDEESHLLESLLYELRMRFVERSKG